MWMISSRYVSVSTPPPSLSLSLNTHGCCIAYIIDTHVCRSHITEKYFSLSIYIYTVIFIHPGVYVLRPSSHVLVGVYLSLRIHLPIFREQTSQLGGGRSAYPPSIYRWIFQGSASIYLQDICVSTHIC